MTRTNRERITFFFNPATKPETTTDGTKQITKLTIALFWSYLLGLLAKIKCSICSYQLNLWYGGHWPPSRLNSFLDHGRTNRFIGPSLKWPRYCTHLPSVAGASAPTQKLTTRRRTLFSFFEFFMFFCVLLVFHLVGVCGAGDQRTTPL